MWEPHAWIYLSLGCTTFLGCASLQLCPAVVWEDGGSRCAFCQPVHGGAGSGVLFLLAVSSPWHAALLHWWTGSVCVRVLMLWLHMRR